MISVDPWIFVEGGHKCGAHPTRFASLRCDAILSALATFAATGLLMIAARVQACPLVASGNDILIADAPRGVQARLRPSIPLRADDAIEFEVDACASTAVESLRFDAHMPAHRHGMNYTPTAQRIGENRFRVRGVIFHMPGEWELLVDIKHAAGALRLRHRVDIP